MKRSLLTSVCAASLAVVMFTSAQATLNLALELRYDDPNNESAGGQWRLVAKDTSDNGVAGLSAVLENIDATGLSFHPSHSISPANESLVYNNGAVNVVFGHDLAPAVTGVGTAGHAQNRATDPFGNTAWNDAAVLISGTFSGSRPAFGTGDGGKVTEANVYSGTTAVAASIGLTNVRGDSVATDGLIIGDLDRGGDVDLFGDVLTALGNVGQSPAGWDDGDFDSSGDVDLFGDVLTALGNVGQSRTPPAIAAVPEPTSLSLLSLAMVGFLGARRRR